MFNVIIIVIPVHSGRFMMKISCRVLNVKALMQVFPDAQLIMLHREPKEMVRIHSIKNPIARLENIKCTVISGGIRSPTPDRFEIVTIVLKKHSSQVPYLIVR